jgi:hypothetical protein
MWLRHDVVTGRQLDPYDDIEKLRGATSQSKTTCWAWFGLIWFDLVRQSHNPVLGRTLDSIQFLSFLFLFLFFLLPYHCRILRRDPSMCFLSLDNSTAQTKLIALDILYSSEFRVISKSPKDDYILPRPIIESTRPCRNHMLMV